MRELALHILDIAENSVAARAQNITIIVDENSITDRLFIAIQDDGCGMDAETAAKVVDPFVTSRTTRKVGLGIPLLKAAAEACQGWLTITSAVGRGTRLEVSFQRSHIDRMPLGDLPGTLLTLVIAYPHIHWQLDYQVDGSQYLFDDQEIKAVLGDVSLSEPGIITYIREMIQDGVAAIQPAA